MQCTDDANHLAESNLHGALPERHPVEHQVLDLVVHKFHLAALYPYQELVIRSILERGGLFGPDRKETSWNTQIVVLPTGSGKSVCFMLPSLLLPGITIAVYPLLSLMNDQCRRMESMGFASVQLRGGMEEHAREEIFAQLEQGKTKFLITNPEMLMSETVLERLTHVKISLMVIDEAHTVSQWGDTFRPAYHGLGDVIRHLHPDQITAFTATASPAIVQRITRLLFNGIPAHVVLGNPDRPNISYRVLCSISKVHDVELLCKHSLHRPLVIFCSTRYMCESLAWSLVERLDDHNIRFYHAGLDKRERKATETWFFDHPKAILCATCAYGMGVDKANIRSIIHFDMPPDAESYLQESGRAGRDGKPAHAVVLVGKEEYLRLHKSSCPQRYVQLCRVFLQQQKCRREALLHLMGTEHDSCSGCDVCNRSVAANPPEADIILSFVRTHPLAHAKETVAHTLSGSRSRLRCPDKLRASPWFGRLPGWSSQDVSDALDCLIEMGFIHERPHWPWSGKLIAIKKSWNIQSCFGERQMHTTQ